VRVELHPDGDFFFVEDSLGYQQKAVEAFAEQWLPELADEV
jgi:hypothetical protein